MGIIVEKKILKKLKQLKDNIYYNGSIPFEVAEDLGKQIYEIGNLIENGNKVHKEPKTFVSGVYNSFLMFFKIGNKEEQK